MKISMSTYGISLKSVITEFIYCVLLIFKSLKTMAWSNHDHYFMSMAGLSCNNCPSQINIRSLYAQGYVILCSALLAQECYNYNLTCCLVFFPSSGVFFQLTI